MSSSRLTTITFNYSRARLNRLGAHRLHIAAAEKTPAGHPQRHGKGQDNSRNFDEQGRFHPAEVYSEKHKSTKTLQVLCNRWVGSLIAMSIDKNKIKTQDELNEPAPMDQADERARAEMERIERDAKEKVAEGLRQTDDDD